MNILFLSAWYPYPANNGSKLRIFNLLSGLSEHHDVTLLSFVDPSDACHDTSPLLKICSQLYTVPLRKYNPQSQIARLAFLSSKPRFLVDTYSAQLESEIRRLVMRNKFDLVIASQLTMASYYKVFKNIPSVFEEIELGIFHDEAFSKGSLPRRMRSWFTWFKLKTYLSHLLKSFALCTMVSDKEQTIFTDSFPSHKTKAVVIPNCVEVKKYQITGIKRKYHHLIFSGSFRYAANYHAILWFLEKVYPLVLEHVPDTMLIITGDHCGLPLPMNKNIECTGHVENIKSLIASCNVSIVPIWSGGGTRLKILEAMAAGTPVVATSKGAEGLLARNGQHLLIADEPQNFAVQVTRLLLDTELNEQLASNAFQFVKENYDWEGIMPRFIQTVEKVAIG